MNATVIQALWGPSTSPPPHGESHTRHKSGNLNCNVTSSERHLEGCGFWSAMTLLTNHDAATRMISDAKNLTHLHWILALWLLLLSSTIQRMLLVTKSKHLALFVCLYVFLEINICTLFKTRDHYSLLLFFWSRPGDKFQGPWRGFKYPISGSGFSDLWHRSQITRRPECLISVPLPDAPVLNLWNKPQCLTSVCSG